MDPYYYQQQHQQQYPRQQLLHHLYAPTLPHIKNILPHQRTIQSLFISDNLRQQLTERNEAQLQTVPACDLGLPLEVHVYHSLYPLSDDGQYRSYKAICSVDGCTYTLLRIPGYRLVNELAMGAVESWSRIRHCNIVSIREAFTTRAFGDSSLVFVYDYHPCSVTLEEYHSDKKVIPENVMWSYITQIASAIQAVHHAGLAARNINRHKIILTGENRIRLNEGSVIDVVQYDNNTPLNLSRYQQEDLLSFGKLIVTLACNNNNDEVIQQLTHSFDMMSRYYSADLKNALLYLFSKPTATKSIDEFITIISPFILEEINNTQFYNDCLENELSRELENGRLVRLLSKMGFINERPEFDMDPSWSETGDRYLIKLFRDYVFHQVDEKGQPVIDMVHVITCLNKLDAGIDEKIMLMSRDDQSCLIVSYKEIKNCIQSAFTDLTSGRK
ncbi:hypothetical protein K501DRAFT_189181 [Backusella circina FSU 941]|nr:hypothetical protein K501DRAFT_189181 [Backusella circina FSU 941]